MTRPALSTWSCLHRRHEPQVREQKATPMAQQLINTKDLTGMKVWIEKPRKKDPDATKKMGKVRACVFHPREKRCVGFIVKRPDVAWMFHRKDLFVAYNGYDVVDGAIVVRDAPEATDKGACNALGVNWDECVLWVGLPVMCQDGTDFGLVGSISYDAETGAIVSLDVTQGATANALLGQRHVPASMIKGFRYGMGAELVFTNDEEEDAVRGAILVDDAVKELVVEGGFAEKAGEATAVVADKAHHAVETVKPKVSEAAAVAGEAVNKGAYATGRQLKRASGMFSEFKEEYDKARGLEQPDKGKSEQAAPDRLDAGDEEVEYVFLDENGDEIQFVDEEGNVITDPALIDESFEEAVVIETGGAASAKPAAAKGGKATSGSAAEKVGAHLKKASGMFSAFKEEYDKARHE